MTSVRTVVSGEPVYSPVKVGTWTTWVLVKDEELRKGGAQRHHMREGEGRVERQGRDRHNHRRVGGDEVFAVSKSPESGPRGREERNTGKGIETDDLCG